MQSDGIISPVTFLKWVAPIVSAVKSDGKIRICGDHKLTINQSAKVEKYTLPRAEEIFASQSDGSKLSKLDLALAYLQLCLDENPES